MKIFQIFNGFCHWDATPKHPTLETTEGLYSPDTLFVEAPDYVFEMWGFDETKEGDERFIQPETPEGWVYDPKTGTFYPEDYVPEPPLPDISDLAAENNLLKAQIGALSERGEFIEDVIAEMAMQVYE